MSLFAQTMTIICAVGAATAAGAFFTFSRFTMEGLKRLAPAQGAAAMQAINKEAPTPLFMLLLIGHRSPSSSADRPPIPSASGVRGASLA
jgi:uncharacterized membrane protein